jgi:hypothetical protein
MMLGKLGYDMPYNIMGKKGCFMEEVDQIIQEGWSWAKKTSNTALSNNSL